MEIVTVSSKFQVVIPLALRRELGIRAGQRVEVRAKDGRLELVPLKPIREYRGFLKGTVNDFEREPDREL
ncbi:MAG: AbrB/MazE/SpoVT family DNA-binding domain-containing protein [bacterium]